MEEAPVFLKVRKFALKLKANTNLKIFEQCFLSVTLIITISIDFYLHSQSHGQGQI